jgi:SPP1 family predicted phage head-tail adaptor
MYKPLCAGDLSHRLLIRKPFQSQSSTGAITTGEWRTFATVWGRLESLSGKELIAAQQVQSQIVARATIRYRADILALAQANTPIQILCNSIPYVVEAMLPDERFADALTLMLSTGTAQ